MQKVEWYLENVVEEQKVWKYSLMSLGNNLTTAVPIKMVK